MSKYATKELKKALKKKGVWEAFKRNAKGYSFMTGVPLSKADCLSIAFNWRSTPEGFRYWSGLFDGDSVLTWGYEE